MNNTNISNISSVFTNNLYVNPGQSSILINSPVSFTNKLITNYNLDN
jgi:hypothetical protein